MLFDLYLLWPAISSSVLAIVLKTRSAAVWNTNPNSPYNLRFTGLCHRTCSLRHSSTRLAVFSFSENHQENSFNGGKCGEEVGPQAIAVHAIQLFHTESTASPILGLLAVMHTQPRDCYPRLQKRRYRHVQLSQLERFSANNDIDARKRCSVPDTTTTLPLGLASRDLMQKIVLARFPRERHDAVSVRPLLGIASVSGLVTRALLRYWAGTEARASPGVPILPVKIEM
ncbi:hypothetical protein K438DRAFT_1767380 [Mycena galopus ATCC 62051]|nr:hypothetical protein K438DRAFT_1767380 [Mycena galopus ATCC 62051]